METTLQIEMENANSSWLDLVRTPGMRRRFMLGALLGLFTQWSGNTLISYYLSDLLEMIGRSDSVFKQQINVASACWSLICGVTISMFVTKFKRRPMFLVCTIGLLMVYIGWTVSMERAVAGADAGTPNEAANATVLFFIFAYKPFYSIGYNVLCYSESKPVFGACLLYADLGKAYLVELWPYAQRSRGIAAFQLFSRLAAFFTTFVNPIGLSSISWKYLISYCVFLAFEIVVVFWTFPETFGRTLEELTFREFPMKYCGIFGTRLILHQCLRTRSTLSRLIVQLRKLAESSILTIW